MIIAFNARLLTERKGGPYRYAHTVIRLLAEIDKKNTYHIILNKDISLGFDLPGNFSKVVLKTKSRVIFEYILLPLYSWKNKIDIFVFPKNTFSPMIRGKKIPVYNDIIYFEKGLNFREFNFFDNLHHRLMIPVAGRFSSANIAISDFTASRMTALLKIKKERIRIIKDGVEESFKKINDDKSLARVINKFNITCPFYFYSGSLSPRKNMLRVVRAFAMIKDRIPHKIYFTASDSWRDDAIHAVIVENGLQDRIIRLGYLDEEELVAVYNLADCYLYPSIYEGFGLPILEAQACGCPVITSNVSSCPEVAGDAAVQVDPYDIGGISEAMLRVVTDEKLRNGLIRRGFQNCRKFSWYETAKKHLGLFEELNTE
jgi:glycosyltransferase involved in cell wall biosynthesis